MTHYYKATDGKFTVFRHSNTRVYNSARMRIIDGSVAEIVFSSKSTYASEPGSYTATEIRKAEYDDLVRAEIDRRRRLKGSLANATKSQVKVGCAIQTYRT
jgi:hypothetical protein